MSGVPKILIIGLPNVGKSTLFNRLVGKRVAIVDSTPNVTRDVLKGEFEWNGEKFQVLDSAGLHLKPGEYLLEEAMMKVDREIVDADVVLFLVDGSRPPTDEERRIADFLRANHSDKVFLVVNKVDNEEREAESSVYWSLGFPRTFFISAYHNIGVADLLDAIYDFCGGGSADGSEEEVRIALVGRQNVGKSSLMNCVLKEDRVVVSSVPGTTRDPVDEVVEFDGRRIRFVDTAGLRKKTRIDDRVEYYSYVRTKQAIEKCHVALVVVDGYEGFVDRDVAILREVEDYGKGIVLVANKWDLVGGGKKRKVEFEKYFRSYLPSFYYVPVLFTSAVKGWGTDELVPKALAVYEEWSKRVPTSYLNRFFEDYKNTYSFPTHKGKELKVYFISQVKSQPPTFKLFVNYRKLVKEGFLSHLERKLRDNFCFEGSPLKFLVQERGKRRKKG